MSILWFKDDLQAKNKTKCSSCSMKATLTFTEHIDEIMKCIEPELDKQAKFKITVEKGDALTFTIEADTIASLRAGVNGITQMVSVFYKNG